MDEGALDSSTYRSDFRPVELLVTDLEQSRVLQVQNGRDLLVPVAHDEGAPELVELSLLQARVARREQGHQSEHCVHVVLARHLGFQRCQDLPNIGLLMNNVILHLEALHVVNALLTLLDIQGDINMVVEELLALRNVHFLDVSHVVCHLFDRHLGLLLVHNVLDFLELPTGHLTKSTQAQVPDLLVDKVILISQPHRLFGFWVQLIVLDSCWRNDFVLDIRVSAANREGLVDSPLVVLLDQEG